MTSQLTSIRTHRDPMFLYMSRSRVRSAALRFWMLPPAAMPNRVEGGGGGVTCGAVTTTVGDGIRVIEASGVRAELFQTWLAASAGVAAPGPPPAFEPNVTVTRPPFWPKLKPET